MSTIRVVLKWQAGFAIDRASDEERERNNKASMAMWEKWKADPDITYVCYYQQPQPRHTLVLEVADFAKIDEMNQDFNEAREAGWLLALHSMDIVRGLPNVDEWWAS